MRLSCDRFASFRSTGRAVAALLLLSGLGILLLWAGPPRNSLERLHHASHAILPVHTESTANNTVLTTYSNLPLIFEQNQGQTDAKVKFLARGSAYGLFLTSDAAVLKLQRAAEKPAVLSMRFSKSDANAEVRGEQQLPGRSSYFIGNDPAKWHRDIPQYARVRYANVYPGIDLVFYGNRGRLEYDFKLAPGTDPSRVGLKFEGHNQLAIDSNGDLLVTLSGGDLRLQPPRAYQMIGGHERRIVSRFQLRSENEVGFAVGPYDRARELVIDPVLTYSTYLGGTGDEGCSVILATGTPVSGCPAVAVDPASNAYIAGSTTSADFPVAGSPEQAGLRGTANIFIAKFNAVANTLLFSTYLGGSGKDYTAGVGVDSATDVIVGGTTTSANFPTTTTAFQKTRTNANSHAFVSKLDPTGHTLVYSTYLSGNGSETASGLAVGQSDQNAYIIGTTTSTNTPNSSSIFPATLGAYQIAPANGSRIQFFVSKINPNLGSEASLAYSTYFGGGNPSSGVALGGGIAVDINNNVYITGGTNFLHIGAANDFPILNADQGCLNTPVITTTPTTCSANSTNTDAFAAEFNPNATTGSQLLYSTYVGGSGSDVGYGIATDGTSAYVTGSTNSTDFPVAGSGVLQTTNGGGIDAFLAKLANPVTTGTTPGLVTLGYFTYLGGSGTDVGLAVAVDTIQGARLTGWTNSSNLPVLNNTNVQPGYQGGNDAFVARVDTTATSSTAPGHYFTYLGGSGADYGTGIAVDPQGASYVAGETNSGTFPTASAFQTNLAGGTDAFLSKLGPSLAFSLTGTSSPPTVGVGNQISFAYTITNTGDAASNVIFTDSLPSSGASFTSATISPGSCGSASGNIVSCTIGTLNAGATATATVVLTPTASTTPSTTSLTVGNTGSVTVQGCSACSQSVTTSATVNDYNITVSPSTATVPAGVPATYTATISPTGTGTTIGFPESVSISCSSGLPTGATCTESTNPIPNLNSGAASTTLIINTTARATTITQLRRHGVLSYASWLPVGVVLLGMGMGNSGRRRWLMALLVAGFCALMIFQAGCSSKSSITTTSGTPAGTYLVTVTATTGSATRNATVTLVVQ